jgi:hypothetical protein
LPAKKDPNEKINVIEILKDSIGKDLSRFAVPGINQINNLKYNIIPKKNSFFF